MGYMEPFHCFDRPGTSGRECLGFDFQAHFARGGPFVRGETEVYVFCLRADHAD